MPASFPRYAGFRYLATLLIAVVWAWYSRWAGSFVIFIIPFYQLFVLALWRRTVDTVFVPKQFLQVPPPFLSLGLSHK